MGRGRRQLRDVASPGPAGQTFAEQPELDRDQRAKRREVVAQDLEREQLRGEPGSSRGAEGREQGEIIAVVALFGPRRDREPGGREPVELLRAGAPFEHLGAAA